MWYFIYIVSPAACPDICSKKSSVGVVHSQNLWKPQWAGAWPLPYFFCQNQTCKMLRVLEERVEGILNLSLLLHWKSMVISSMTFFLDISLCSCIELIMILSKHSCDSNESSQLMARHWANDETLQVGFLRHGDYIEWFLRDARRRDLAVLSRQLIIYRLPFSINEDHFRYSTRISKNHFRPWLSSPCLGKLHW